MSAWSSFREITFQEPWFVNNHFLTPCLELLDALGHLFDSAVPAADRQRLTRSLEWFRIAHSGADSVLPASRVVMMSTTFETLLGMEQSSRSAFADGLKRLIPTDNMEQAKRPKAHEKKCKQRVLSLLECWGWDFYVLRSEIVHGDLVGPPNLVSEIDGLNHLTIADAIFGEAIIQDLNRLKCIAYDANDAAQQIVMSGCVGSNQFGSVEDWAKYFFDNHFGFRQLHQKLGWLKQQVKRFST